MNDQPSATGHGADCRHCGAAMYVHQIKTHPGAWPYLLAGVGLFLTLFMGGLMIGVPLILIGIYMGKASETIRLCPDCGYYYKIYQGDKKE